MLKLHPTFNVNSDGKKVSVVLPIEEFNSLMDQLDELEDIRLFDSAKKDDEPSLPIDEAFRLIEEERSKS